MAVQRQLHLRQHRRAPAGRGRIGGERTDLVAHSSPAPGPGQDGPHAHQIVTAPDGDHILAVDLGNDTVYTYRLDETDGTLEQVSYAALRPGAGPRHLTFHPDGTHAYLACELDNTVVVCGYDPATGTLTPGDPQSTGTGSGTSYPAQFLVTGDGRFAYLANRGHNSVTRYAVEDGGAALRLLDTVPVGGDFPGTPRSRRTAPCSSPPTRSPARSPPSGWTHPPAR